VLFLLWLPQFNYPTSIDIEFWDTCFLTRNITIPNVGNKFSGHQFESPNISDSFGAYLTSGGREGNVKNENADQRWFPADVIKSDNFVAEGLINGLAFYRSTNRKDFSSYPWGAIMAIITQRSIVAFICTNDFFTTDFNFHYSYANEQGVMVVNLNAGLSTPHQKVGDTYGVSEVDICSLVVYDKYIFYYDRKNTAWVQCDYRSAIDISNNGMESYFNIKTDFITQWNNAHELKDRFDVISGVDLQLGNLIVTFRPRRGNTNLVSSFINSSRNWQLDYQETLVYNIETKRWTRSENFTPECYGKLRGNSLGTELISFVSGQPYNHNNTPNDSFLIFYGVQTEPILICVVNTDPAFVKTFQSLAHDSNANAWYVDSIYTNEKNSFSYLSLNQFKKKENQWYAAILRDMNSYPPINEDELFRSMLQDGKRLFGRYMVFRLVGNPETLNVYTQLSNIYYKYIQSGNNTK